MQRGLMGVRPQGPCLTAIHHDICVQMDAKHMQSQKHPKQTASADHTSYNGAMRYKMTEMNTSFRRSPESTPFSEKTRPLLGQNYPHN